jgi:hypothetical protein
MKLKFINPVELDRNMKATVHRSGKLGFTLDAMKKLGLGTTKSLGIAINEDDPTDKNLYVVIYPQVKEDAFRVSKAGEYFYINTKALFDSLKLDYLKDNIVYDIIRDNIDGQEIFVFKRRETAKKTNSQL